MDADEFEMLANQSTQEIDDISSLLGGSGTVHAEDELYGSLKGSTQPVLVSNLTPSFTDAKKAVTHQVSTSNRVVRSGGDWYDVPGVSNRGPDDFMVLKHTDRSSSQLMTYDAIDEVWDGNGNLLFSRSNQHTDKALVDKYLAELKAGNPTTVQGAPQYTDADIADAIRRSRDPEGGFTSSAGMEFKSKHEARQYLKERREHWAFEGDDYWRNNPAEMDLFVKDYDEVQKFVEGEDPLTGLDDDFWGGIDTERMEADYNAAKDSQVHGENEWNGMENSQDYVPDEYPREEVQQDYFFTQGFAALRAIEEAAMEVANSKPLRLYEHIDELPPGTLEQVESFLKLRGEEGLEVDGLAMRFAKARADSGLLNYSRKYSFNSLLGNILPFEFFKTTTMTKWLTRSADRPAMLQVYLKSREYLEESESVDGDSVPDWLRRTIKVYQYGGTGLSEDIGNIYVDPLKVVDSLGSSYGWSDKAIARKDSIDGRTESILEYKASRGEIDEDEAKKAIESHTGPLWDEISNEAQLDIDGRKYGILDFMSIFSMPHAPLTWINELWHGTEENIGPQSPVGQYSKGIQSILEYFQVDITDAVEEKYPELKGQEAWEWVVDNSKYAYPHEISGAGRLKTNELYKNGMNWLFRLSDRDHTWIEKNRPDWFLARMKREINLVGFDKWEEIRDERNFINLVAERGIHIDVAKEQFMSKSGDYWDEAERISALQYGVGALSSLLAIPAKFHIPGSEQVSQAMADFKETVKLYDAGDIDAYEEFFEKEPWYSLEQMVWKTEDERWRKFASDHIYDSLNNMTSIERRQVEDVMGEGWVKSVYDGLLKEQTTAQLQSWMRTFGGPTFGIQDPLDKAIDFISPEIARQCQVFYTSSNYLYPGVFEFLPEYMTHSDTGRETWREENPDKYQVVQMYYTHKQDFIKRNPHCGPFLAETPSWLRLFATEKEYQDALESVPNYAPSEIVGSMDGDLQGMVYDYIFNDEDIPASVQPELDEYAANLGLTADSVLQMAAGEEPDFWGRNEVINAVMDIWGTTSSVHKREYKELLGFDLDEILYTKGSEERLNAFGQFTTPELVSIARVIGLEVDGQPAIKTPGMTSDVTAKRVDIYWDTFNEIHPKFYEYQEEYLSLSEREQKSWFNANPEKKRVLLSGWDYREDYIRRFPDTAPHIMRDVEDDETGEMITDRWLRYFRNDKRYWESQLSKTGDYAQVEVFHGLPDDLKLPVLEYVNRGDSLSKANQILLKQYAKSLDISYTELLRILKEK